MKSALDYIMDKNKTYEKILISSKNCNPITAHLEFEQTKIKCNSKAKVLATIYAENINCPLLMRIIKNLNKSINPTESLLRNIWNLRKDLLGNINLKLLSTMLLIEQIAMKNF